MASSVIPKLRFNYDFEAFFPNEDSELELYERYRNTFEYDNEFILIAAENKKGIFKADFLRRFDSLTKELTGLTFVRQVTSATNLKIIDYSGLVPVSKPVLNIDDPALYTNDSAKIYRTGHFIGSFFPKKGTSLCIFIMTEPGLSKKRSDLLGTAVMGTLSKYHFDEVHVVGRIFAQKTYIDILQREFILFICIALLLITVFLWFTFRNIYGVVLPVIIIATSILFTLAIMYLCGREIDLMITILPTMIFIAGMSDVVHFFSKYFEELQKGTSKIEIVRKIRREVGFPTFITLLTTVVAFLSLLFSNIKPIRDFGLFTSLGITIAFILTYTLLPAILYFWSPNAVQKVLTNSVRVTNGMRRSMIWVFGNQRFIIIITLVLIAISLVGITKIRINNILLDDLNDKVKIKQDFNFFDKNYSGARPLEILVELRSDTGSVWDYAVLKQLEKVEDFIKKTYNPGFLLSPVRVAKSMWEAESGEWKIPKETEYGNLKKKIINNRKNKHLLTVVTVNGRQTRFSGKIADIGSHKAQQLNQELMAFIEKNTDARHLHFSITGAGHLIDRNNEYMVDNMLQGFGFSVIVIGLLTFVLHRSWRMVLVFIIPNVIPLIFIGGIMGYFEIELKAATSLIFSIAFGIATDDTIHFISRLRLESSKGKSLLYAFKRTYFETGKPILYTTFILIGGFMSLMTSSFQSTFYFGFLICITVILALLCDLFLLPVLLFCFYPSKSIKKG
jgi:predicted RND superfamily exporter protein